MKKCPFCKEEIQDEALKCKHCHEFLDSKPERKTVEQRESDGADVKVAANPVKKGETLAKLKKLIPLLGWVFGVLFFIGGVSAIFQGNLLGVFILLISIIIIPPIPKMIGEFFGRDISFPEKAISVILLLFFVGFVTDGNQNTHEDVNKFHSSNQNKIKNLDDYQNELKKLDEDSKIILKQMQQAIDMGEFYANKNYGKKLLHRNTTAIENEGKQQAEINRLKKEAIKSYESAIKIYDEMRKLDPGSSSFYNLQIDSTKKRISIVEEARIRSLNDISRGTVKSRVF